MPVSNPCARCSDSSDSMIDSDDDLSMVDVDDDYDLTKAVKQTKKASEVDYAVYSPQDIETQQQRQIDDVKDVVGQSSEATAILLRHMKWNKERLIDQYMDNHDEILSKAGLSEQSVTPPAIRSIPGFACDICCEDAADLETYALRCQHRFCLDCYRQYIIQKVKDEGEAARIRCPGEGCPCIVDSASLGILLPKDLTERCAIMYSNVKMVLTYSQISRIADPKLRRRQR